MGVRGRCELLAGIIALHAPLGCHRAFLCEDNAQCVARGVQGRCEPSGFCSFPDSTCDSGQRYGEHASLELVDACVADELGSSTQGSTTAPGDASASTSTSLSTSSASGEAESSESTAPVPGDCSMLRESGPVVVNRDGQVVENLRIIADGNNPGITVVDFRDVVIRHCEIHHQGSHGVSFANADNIHIHDVAIEHDRDENGPHAHAEQDNIRGVNSTGVVLERVRITRGASGINLADTPSAHLAEIEGHDIRGPGDANFVRLHHSDQAILEDFSIINPLDTGRPEDLVWINHSSDVIVRRGLLDGHNSRFGYGVLFRQISNKHRGGLVEDVDAVRMTNGGFSAFEIGFAIVFRRTRARDNICEIVSVPIDDCPKEDIGENGGCIPGSGGRSWAGDLELVDEDQLDIQDSAFFNTCPPTPVWPESAFISCDGETSTHPPGDCGLEEIDFVPRAPIELTMCWE
ncbi:MAG: right-handed parallel beta-helix repeat-containing protein [Myxococcota bacterium]